MITFKQHLNELQHMNKVLTKKGREFIDDILNGEVYINLKIDTSALLIKKDSDGLSYFGREGAKEIDTIKRAGSDIWEKAIAHIEKQDWEKLPNGITIATEFYNPKIKTIIPWTKAPKGGMIISWIKMNGKTLPLNDPLYQETADILKITPPPVIFTGKLKAKQKDLINQLLEDPTILTGKDFATKILSIFTLKPEHLFLADELIEGVVIYAADGSVYKITDNLFTVTNKKKNDEKPTDEFFQKVSGIAYKELEPAVDRILNNKASMKKIMNQTGDERYIQFITALTGSIYQKVGKGMKDIDKYRDNVEKNRYSNISSNLVPSGLNSLISKKWWTEDLARILLYGIRKEKKRIHKPSGLTLDRKNSVNKVVQQLKDAKIL